MKELTEEREKLSIDFKEENDELKNKIRALEREIEFLNTELDKHESSKYQSHHRKSDSSDGIIINLFVCYFIIFNLNCLKREQYLSFFSSSNLRRRS